MSIDTNQCKCTTSTSPFDFDRSIDRHNTCSLKYDFAPERGLPADVLPLWVADMDFATAPCVQEALATRVNHGIFGYSDVKESYTDAVISWFANHYSWKPEAEWIVKTPGVVYALATCVRALTNPGDAIVIQPPVYYPFFEVIRDNDRIVAQNPLIFDNGAYRMDYEGLEQVLERSCAKLLILCSPHNPVGRVWTQEELHQLAEVCARHDVIVVSDEIHCDFTFAHSFVPFALAAPELLDRMVICTAPSKTFNIASLQVSNIFIPQQDIRQKFCAQMRGGGYSQLNIMGLVATETAYVGGAEWLEALKDYLAANLNYLRAFLEQRIPRIKLIEPEGTYFAWLDCSELGLTSQELDELIIHKAHLWLDAGHIFGTQGHQFQRLVYACPRATLTQALTQLEAAVHN